MVNTAGQSVAIGQCHFEGWWYSAMQRGLIKSRRTTISAVRDKH